MPEAPVLGASKKVKLDEAAFGARFRTALVHESVRAEQAARRRGTAATKTRGLVSGGGAKPWRQKGTGRARAGSSRSPLWTGGGIVFGPQPRSYTFKVNRKERRAALRSALSLHAGRGSIAILDASAFDAPSTKQANDLLEDWGQDQPTLVVLASDEHHAALSFRNIRRLTVRRCEDVGVADVLGAASLLVSEPALKELAERASAPARRDAAQPGAAPASTTRAASKAPAEAPAAERKAPAKPAAEAPVAPRHSAGDPEPAEQEAGG
jgi:large subunit ribosomal protein L4